MLNLDPAKLLIIAVVAVILLGPDRLPQLARQVGGYWRSFNEYRHRMESQVRESMPDLPSTTEITRLVRSPTALLDHLSTMGSDSEKDKEKAVAPGPNEPSRSDVATSTAPMAQSIPRPAEAPSPEPAVSGDPVLN